MMRPPGIQFQTLAEDGRAGPAVCALPSQGVCPCRWRREHSSGEVCTLGLPHSAALGLSGTLRALLAWLFLLFSDWTQELGTVTN